MRVYVSRYVHIPTQQDVAPPSPSPDRSYLIVKIIVRQLSSGKLSDVREEDDDSDDEKED